MPELLAPAAPTWLEATTDGVRAGLRMGGGPFRVVVLERGSRSVRAALVPTTALLLAGDRVGLEVTVGAGCLLELTEPAGTVAYDMAGGSASWQVEVRVEPGGRLVWQAPEFVVASGASVDRGTTVRLAGDATCLIRETLVLGRSGESPGRLEVRTRVYRDDRPVLVERFAAGPDAQVPGLLGRNRVIDQVLDLRPAEDRDGLALPGAMGLAGGGSLHRRLSGEAHAGCLDATWAALVGSGS